MAFGDDGSRELLDLVRVLFHRTATIGDNRRTTESQADRRLLARGMNRIRVDATRERFRGLAKLSMNAAESLLVQEHTGSVGLMREPISLRPWWPALPLEQRVAGWRAIICSPALRQDSLPFLLSDFDRVLPTTTSTVVTTPVLNRWQGERDGHDRASTLDLSEWRAWRRPSSPRSRQCHAAREAWPLSCSTGVRVVARSPNPQ